MTQNVDGLHVESLDHNVIEVHGRADKLYCTGCGKPESGRHFLFQGGHVKKGEIPRCSDCSGIIRPDVVLFGEFLSDVAQDKMKTLQNQGVDLVLSIGTSSLFPYIKAPVELARKYSIPVYEINPKKTEVSYMCNYRFESGCTETLEAILKRV